MRLKPLIPIAFILFTMGCGNAEPEQQNNSNLQEDVSPAMNKEFDLQGHRGARGLFPENTIEGFLAAVDLMVNTLELDVVISKDNKVVVSHEPWISSTICWGLDDKPAQQGKDLNIYMMDYSEVSNYNCGRIPHPDFPLQAKINTFKPLLSEVISEVEASSSELELEPVKFNIEIKSTEEGDNVFHPEPKEFCQIVYDQIVSGGIKNRTTIQSFDVRALQAMKQLDSSIPVALLIYESQGFEQDLEKLGFTPEVYSPYYKLVDESLVEVCKLNNIKLIPWTVNDEEDMVDLLELGVDGLITDYPDVALTLKM